MRGAAGEDFHGVEWRMTLLSAEAKHSLAYKRLQRGVFGGMPYFVGGRTLVRTRSAPSRNQFCSCACREASTAPRHANFNNLRRRRPTSAALSGIRPKDEKPCCAIFNNRPHNRRGADSERGVIATAYRRHTPIDGENDKTRAIHHYQAAPRRRGKCGLAIGRASRGAYCLSPIRRLQ